MYTVSSLFTSLVSQDDHWFHTKVTINGVEYGEDVLMSVHTKNRVFSGEQPEVGGCLAGELEVKMIAPDEDIPRMAEVVPYVCVTNGTETSEWIPQGHFFIDTRETSRNESSLQVLTLHCYDAMLKTEADYPSTDDDWPKQDMDVVYEIASTIGVSVDSRTAELITAAYEIGLPVGYSMREVLSNIAAMYAGNFIMNYDGELRFVGLSDLPVETNYLIDRVGDVITFGTGVETIQLSGNAVTINNQTDTYPFITLVSDIDYKASGWTGTNITVAGKNLFNKNNYSFFKGYFASGTSTTTITANSSHTIVYIPCKPNTTYTAQRIRGGTNERFRIGWSEVAPAAGITVYNTVGAVYTGTIGDQMTITTTTGATAKYLALWAWWSSSGSNPEDTLMIEEGFTASTYEAFSGNVYSVNFNDLDTIYGGAFDIVSGVLTSTLDASGNELQTPVEYQLTPTEASTMLGSNYIFSTTGAISLSYLYGGEVTRILV